MTNTATLKRIWFLAGLFIALALSAGQMSVAHAVNLPPIANAGSDQIVVLVQVEQW